MKLNQLRSLIKEEIEKKLSEDEGETTKKVEVTPKEKEIADDILGGDEINEASFGKVRDRLLSALKKGAVTLGVLTAVIGSPKLAQAQKDVLKKDIKQSTWFKSEVKKVGSDGRYGEYMHRWVNDLGQDSTEYVLHLGGGDHYYDRGASMTQRTKPASIDSISRKAGKVKPNKINIGDQSMGSATVIMKGGDVDDFLWAKGYSNEWTERITPRQYRELQKLEKLVKDVEYRSEDFWKIIDSVGKEIYKGNDDNKKVAWHYLTSDYGTPQSTNKTNNKAFYSPNFVK